MTIKSIPAVSQRKMNNKFLQVFSLYTGAFLFSIIMTILVHELGHFLAYQLRGYDAAIRINPFMGATSTQQQVHPQDYLVLVLGGTLFNMTVATLTSVLLHFVKSPYWLPFRMYPAVAFFFEGVVIITGLFFKETVTDFAWLKSLGWHPVIIGIVGTLLILAGAYLLYEIWLLLGIEHTASPMRLLLLNIPILLYSLAGFLIGQSIAIDLDFFKRFLAASALLQWLALGMYIMLYPAIAPFIEKRMERTIPRITSSAGIFSLCIGCGSWAISLLW